ncbi:hypothetical protein PsAD46_01344 [Pseudovibrio sp. Ad46]|nr:hypothetical protein PsAD46_01344 [Pseudovibrio sp. Ad46]KZK98908.1 hypothetical protein PsAD5_01531 [Pseudovibrio sp. Ad5]
MIFWLEALETTICKVAQEMILTSTLAVMAKTQSQTNTALMTSSF